MSERILLVEDSNLVVKILSFLIQRDLGYEVVACRTFAETRAVLEVDDPGFLAAVIDVNLPDAPDGEVIDYALARRQKVVVITASFDDRRRETILNKDVVDYVVKESRYAYDYVVRLLRRLDRNRRIKALVVDDSRAIRSFVRALLELQNFSVLEAADGRQALVVLDEEPSIGLVIVDYDMPVMNGFQLTIDIRRKLEREIAVIGLSAHGSSTLSAKFIKHGANDFLAKPFSHEEFFCRVMQNVEAIEQIEELRRSAHRDFLTKAFNRRYFFDQGMRELEEAVRRHREVAVAMLDLDHFKRVNDVHGHDAGDAALVHVARMLDEFFPDGLVARFGGEEFVVLLSHKAEEMPERLETLRSTLAGEPFHAGLAELTCTFSAGLAVAAADSGLDTLLKCADQALYRAKAAGRNRIERATLGGA